MDIEYQEPWNATGKYADNLVKELEREVTEGHLLFQVEVRAIAQRTDSDDVLFRLPDGRCAVVHLTWSGEPEGDSRWPDTRVFESWEAWSRTGMMVDHAEFIGNE